ncbi:Pkinase-domain-containing protein [Aaosphaeria arxii CBS 175.79]|uniref:non-specific serine/threonine protein kinase n=1 Tax=Aaosphaeria arxii CBS 175.79 TaxID=1450172 RepID=A0A6A5XWZ7_9PLEO|nr:Pkinase-domain-containing protein [Aaosphaeria arxii CBS 175.79]KAF2017858.1 Pkinase-domain-containing protein [Aaosphaeria arxii CBS 175.79]
MSSAAVQASGPALSNRSYQQQQSPQQYYPQQQQSPVAASPSSSRKPSRHHHSQSGNGASPHTPTTPQTHHSPAPSAGSALNTPRAQPLPPSTHASPAMNAPATSAASGGPMPPPRTSSHRGNSSPSASRAPISSTHTSSSDKDRTRDESARRRAKESPRQQGSSSRSKHSPGQPTHSRSATAVGQPPTGTNLPREESTVINRIVVTDPQEDISREAARQAEARPGASASDVTPVTGLGLVGSEGVDDGGRGAGKSRQDHSASTRKSKFGNYILGQTLGEGEFGKVKMGWKKDSNVEVAIKLIRRETLGSNQNRLQKIYREIQILRGLDHPNIVRLHEMVETERHIGIILEYASGGELFDYILNHRYLKDGAARRLFAQLISGVGYLHKRGIVHRDLKLENLLLDKNRNIIITDFGFANTFDANDELGEEIEFNLGNKEFIRSMGLEGTDGNRRGDLMQTSCGSPCYAAPELVVSDSLYTGRKVDVWSCGVILYAMLAGYLPFDDDPDNPEGDNINLLYKYIVSTPLTFPEYVTPHARDLLKRILVPDPRKRADLFEVARHSWLSDYAHILSFITSSSTSSNDVTKSAAYPKDPFDTPSLARSASVREPGKPHTSVTPIGGLTAKRDQINRTDAEKPKTSRDNKRRTVQVEYVAPQSQTARGEASPPAATSSKSRPRDQGPTEVLPTDGYQSSSGARPNRSTAAATSGPSRPTHGAQRSVSDYTAFGAASATSTARPSTGGSRLPSRGNSYGQPVAATVAPTNVEGRFSQPKGKTYSISGPVNDTDGRMGEPSIGRPSTQRVATIQADAQNVNQKGHRRSNTVSETLGRVTSMFSGRQPSDSSQTPSHNSNKIQKSYPPTSMPSPLANEEAPRQSSESSRRSFGFSRKNTDQSGAQKSGRRFSLLPSSLSKTFSNNKESASATERRNSVAPASRSRAASKGMAFGRGGESRSPSQSTQGSRAHNFYDGGHESNSRIRAGPASAPPQQTQFEYPPPIGDEKIPNPAGPHPSAHGYREKPYRHANNSEASEPVVPTSQQRGQYPAGFNSTEAMPPPSNARDRPSVLQKNRKFADAYEDKQGHSGSSGSAKRVMDLFRRIGRQRTKEER